MTTVTWRADLHDVVKYQAVEDPNVPGEWIIEPRMEFKVHFDGPDAEHEASECVERMNSLGVIPDLSHASDKTALDVLGKSSKPVVISHGAARALVDNPRCAPDAVLRGVGESGGVVGIFMMSCWLTTAAKPTVEHLIAQFRHVENTAGIDAVAIANDFGDAVIRAYIGELLRHGGRIERRLDSAKRINHDLAIVAMADGQGIGVAPAAAYVGEGAITIA